MRRAFLDTSAILAGLNSPTGAAGVILAACFAGKIKPVISRQIVDEAERIIPLKFPDLDTGWVAFLATEPEMARRPTMTQIRRAHVLIQTSDAPILAAAMLAKPDALVTWNTKDFMKPAVLEAVNFPILIPGEFLNWWILR